MDEEYTISLTKVELGMVWQLTETAQPSGGKLIDQIAGLRAKLRPLVKEVFVEK